jgi:N-methylhydantoinase B
MFLPNALLKALAQIEPEHSMAEGSGAVWTMQVNGNHDDGSPFITALFTYAGGVCARDTKPGLDDIEDLADEIIGRSENATRAGIRDLPAGTYRSSALLDLADGSRIDIVCSVRVDPEAGEVTVDYEGSSPASPWGINVVKNYTHAYTTFTVRSVLNPEIPNNHGSLEPIKVLAPEGSIVNAVSPQPCTARHVVGMFLPNALLKALAQVRPEQAMAEGSGAVWTMQVSGNHDDGSAFITAMFTYAGGVGARATKPGLDACSYPTGVAAVNSIPNRPAIRISE